MPLLVANDALPSRPCRILVAGTSGSGKTTLARRIAAVLNVPHTEIDSLYHGPDWVPREQFVNDVHRFSAAVEWVTEWQYESVLAVLVERADLLVWLDLPRAVAMSRLARRTLRRGLRHETLWNGNVEPPLRTAFTDPEHIVRWAWRTRRDASIRVQAAMRARPDLVVVRLERPRQVEAWLNDALY